MKYVPQSFEEIKEEEAYKKIALVAHNCYQVNKDKDQKQFVLSLLGFKHYAMIEHKVFVAKISKNIYEGLVELHNNFIVIAKDKTGIFVHLRYVFFLRHTNQMTLVYFLDLSVRLTTMCAIYLKDLKLNPMM